MIYYHIIVPYGTRTAVDTVPYYEWQYSNRILTGQGSNQEPLGISYRYCTNRINFCLRNQIALQINTEGFSLSHIY
eukprot:COSAG02_NODE_248_length_27133_cov_45.131723_15_plen_76_part_00